MHMQGYHNRFHKIMMHVPLYMNKLSTLPIITSIIILYMCCQRLFNKMVTELLHSTIHANNYRTSLTVTGASGFGKPTILYAFAHVF